MDESKIAGAWTLSRAWCEKRVYAGLPTMWLYIRKLEWDESKRKVQRSLPANRLSFSELFDYISLVLNVRRLCIDMGSRIRAAKMCACVISGMWSRGWAVVPKYSVPAIKRFVGVSLADCTQGSRGYFFLINADGSRRSGVNEARIAESPSREPYRSVSTVYFFLGILRTDLWSLCKLIVPWKTNSRLRKIASRSSFSGLLWHWTIGRFLQIRKW